MKISLDKLIRRETNKLDLNFSQKIDTINYCNNNYKLSSPINIEGFLVKEGFDEDEFEDDDAIIFDGQELDLVDIIEQTLDFKIPASVLCKEDCKGLCQGCGANLNIEACSCNESANDEEIIDPRFAKLKDLFKND